MQIKNCLNSSFVVRKNFQFVVSSQQFNLTHTHTVCMCVYDCGERYEACYIFANMFSCVSLRLFVICYNKCAEKAAVKCLWCVVECVLPHCNRIAFHSSTVRLFACIFEWNPPFDIANTMTFFFGDAKTRERQRENERNLRSFTLYKFSSSSPLFPILFNRLKSIASFISLTALYT